MWLTSDWIKVEREMNQDRPATAVQGERKEKRRLMKKGMEEWRMKRQAKRLAKKKTYFKQSWKNFLSSLPSSSFIPSYFKLQPSESTKEHLKEPLPFREFILLIPHSFRDFIQQLFQPHSSLTVLLHFPLSRLTSILMCKCD